MPSLLVYLVMAAAAVGQPSNSGRLVLIDRGRTEYDIVVGRDALDTTRLAAEELQTYLKAATGVELAIVTAPRAGHRRIDIRSDAQLPPGGFSIKAKGRDIFIRGKDSRGSDGGVDFVHPIQRGTCNAVYELLEQFVGVRWFWGESLGEIVPRQKTISLPSRIDISEQPAFDYRALAYGPSETFDGSWARRNRLGATATVLHYHNLHKLVPVAKWAGMGHPEYASLIDGRRKTEGPHLCLSNPDVVRIASEKVKSAFSRDPQLMMASISLPDGHDFCTCRACQAWDVESHRLPHRSGKGTVIKTDRVLHFSNQVASLVAEDYPDRALGAYIYAQYLMPPAREKRIHPMLALVVAPNTAAYVQVESRWKRTKSLYESWGAAHDRVYAYDILYLLRLQWGLPAPLNSGCADLVRLFARAGIRGCYLYIAQTWESGGADAYLLARMLWDPDVDVERTRREYYGLLYQKAADPVSRYFELAGACWRDSVDCNSGDARRIAKAFHRSPKVARKYANVLLGYGPMLGQLEDAVTQAARLAAGDDLVSRRVARLHDNYELARATIDGLAAVVDYEESGTKRRSDVARLAAAIRAREAVLQRMERGYARKFVRRLRDTDKKINSPLRAGSYYSTLAPD